ncbi:hypothetical protein TNCV_3522121, partial [Trichonephila clavipes]
MVVVKAILLFQRTLLMKNCADGAKLCTNETEPSANTWCKFKSRIAWETYHHKNSLPVDVVGGHVTCFRDLANPELLKKCLHGGDGVPRQTEAVTSKNTIVYKTKEAENGKRLKRKKEDDELLKMLMIKNME